MTKTNDPGLGSSYKHRVRRIINQDGSYNIKRHGGLRGIKDIYKFLIDLSWLQFIGLALVSYLVVNVLFACIYMLVGVDQISGIDDMRSPFFNAFFFSIQTITTVGYGHLSPIGLSANIVAAFESFIGLLGIALITGLLYGRFSKPSSKILFTENIILTPYQDDMAIMLKMVNQRNSTLLNASVRVMLSIDREEAKEGFLKEYHRLPLQIDQIHFFPLTWTIVHIVNEESPLHGLDVQKLKDRNAEIIVLADAFDETHSQNVFERQSYAGDQWLEGVRFTRNFQAGEDGEIDLFIDELNNTESI